MTRWEAKGPFLVSATRLGGLHGYDDAGAVDPLGGSVTGFTKAFKREKEKRPSRSSISNRAERPALWPTF